ncbi:hypothetical protein MMC06_004247 [Schaereria dolodes]|nr:hypothetical protein [Schaereria dolodes]
MRVYARTREREKAWKMGIFCLAGSMIAAPFIMMIFRRKSGWSIMEVLWCLSIILESVCVLPQLLLLRQTTVPTVIDSFYLLTLGSYRAFYILNWIHRYAYERHFDPIAVIFGIIQTAFYLDFAWVYWTRQRVKLRNGGVVDSDDLSRGWLISRVLGKRGDRFHEEEGIVGDDADGGRLHKNRDRWGARGISVSADEGVLDPQQPPKKRIHPGDTTTRNNELAHILEDSDDDSSDDGVLPSHAGAKGTLHAVGSGQEWQDERVR